MRWSFFGRCVFEEGATGLFSLFVVPAGFHAFTIRLLISRVFLQLVQVVNVRTLATPNRFGRET